MKKFLLVALLGLGLLALASPARACNPVIGTSAVFTQRTVVGDPLFLGLTNAAFLPGFVPGVTVVQNGVPLTPLVGVGGVRVQTPFVNVVTPGFASKTVIKQKVRRRR